MPALENQRWEAFARELAKGAPATEAYASAGYKPQQQNASRLMLNDVVQNRVAELQQRAAEKVELDRAWVLDRLMRNARIALGEDQVKLKLMRKGADAPVEVEVTARDPAAANRALELLGKEIGMFVERSENLNTNYTISDEAPSPEQWNEQYGEPEQRVEH